MTIKSSILAGFACFFLTSFACANSVPITGTASYGFATTAGDFRINGSGLSLLQNLPDGPSEIGTCDIGSICNFSFNITTSGASFCSYCTGYASGTLGNNVAELLVPYLTFTGSAFYSGGTSMSVPLTVSGTIIGYQLLNCSSDGSGCELGPEVFSTSISGTGTGTFTMQPLGGGLSVIQGVNVSFSGVATTTPEPVSMVLTGTGLLGILIRTKAGRKKQA